MATAIARKVKSGPVAEPQVARNDSQWAMAWRRLRGNVLAMFGLVVVAVFVAVALLAPFIAKEDPLKFNSGKDFLPPVFVTESAAKIRPDPKYLLGTDTGGRDVFSRVVYGARTSVFVALLPTLLIMTIGTILGLTTGFFGGAHDTIVMRIVDILESFPDILFYIVLGVALRETWFGRAANGLLLLFVSLAVVSWGGLARLVRGNVMLVRSREYVEAARSLGMSNVDVLRRHVFPNILNTVVVWAALAMPRMIINEAVLAYLGLGMQSPSSIKDSYFVTSWGQIINEGRASINTQPWILMSAAACIALIVIGVTFLGNGVRDALDPRMERK